MSEAVLSIAAPSRPRIGAGRVTGAVILLGLIAFAVAAQVSRPARPVKTLEFPAVTTSARAFPPFSASRHQSTGAPGQRFFVNTPATVVPGGNAIIVTSSRAT